MEIISKSQTWITDYFPSLDYHPPIEIQIKHQSTMISDRVMDFGN